MQTYSGKSELKRGVRPPRCQSLHHSHFYIGTSSELDLNTQNTTDFKRKDIIPVSYEAVLDTRLNQNDFALKILEIKNDSALLNTRGGNLHFNLFNNWID